MAKELLKGNVAVAEAGLRGGMDFFAGYPITPSSEALEYLSSRMEELGLGDRFIQGENEIASMNMVMGASALGARAFTASSGPGISLKAEGVSYASRYELPFVMLNVQRWGVGLGSLQSGQGDYMRETKGGGHGDYHNIVYAPYNIQELVDDAYEAWDAAEKYRVGVTILSEAYLGQMMESVELPEFKKRNKPLDWGIDGTGKVGLRYLQNGDELLNHRREKYAKITAEMQRWENVQVEDADYVFVAWGLPARVCIDAVERLRAKGEKVGLIRPKIIWPYPVEAFKAVNPKVKAFISVETNDLGQMVEDVALSAKKCNFNVPVYCYAHSAGTPGVKRVMSEYEAIKEGKVKERF